MVTEKEALRAQLLERRRAMEPSKRAADSLELGRNIAALLDARGVAAHATVAVYQAMGDEANLAALIALLYAQGARVAFPCVRSADVMEFYALSASDLDAGLPPFLEHPGRFFPDADLRHLHLLAPEDIDVMMVPGVGFDRVRARLGMGAGCYDRYLPTLRPDCLKIGVCFDEQLVDAVPAGPHDIPVDVVVTPSIAF